MLRSIRAQILTGYLGVVLSLALAWLVTLLDAQPARAGYGHIVVVFAVIFAAALGLGILVTRWTERALGVLPRALGQATARLGRGELARPVTVQGAAEFARALHMEVMHRRLAGSRREEERATDLEAQAREQQAFMHAVSHDLKAPLLSIQGMADLLASGYGEALDAEGKLYLGRIAANATRMRAMLDDLLAMASVGHAEAEFSLVDLGAVVHDVTEQLGYTLHTRGAQVCVDGPLPTVHADSPRLRQVFTNLIDNAVTYTPAGRAPVVRLDSTTRPDGWEIMVRDNGVGIPPAWQERVFGVFQRLPAGRALNPGGTGLGLAIVARIVEAHGGRLWLESEEGAGTTFHFTLPRRATLTPGVPALAVAAR